MRNDIEVGRPRTSGLVEVLDRVLDKGLFIGGDVKISLAEVELLTIRIRLIVCSLDKAREIGLDWWTYDRHLAPGKVAAADREALETRLLAIEERLLALVGPGNGAAAKTGAAKPAGTAKAAKPARRGRTGNGSSRSSSRSSTRRS
jgi:hypothetical protein